MSSKRRLRRQQGRRDKLELERGCQGKVRYENKEKAHYGAWCQRQEGRLDIHAYHCRFCRGWHLGHERTGLPPALGAAG